MHGIVGAMSRMRPAKVSLLPILRPWSLCLQFAIRLLTRRGISLGGPRHPLQGMGDLWGMGIYGD